MSHLRRPLAVLAVLAGVLGSAPAAHAAVPPCSPEVAGRLHIVGRTFVAGRSDNGFGPDIRFAVDPVGQFPVASVDESTIVMTASPPASIRTEDGESFLVAPQPGPVTIAASWEEYPASSSACSASDSVAVTVLPGRVPAVRPEPAEVPLAK